MWPRSLRVGLGLAQAFTPSLRVGLGLAQAFTPSLRVGLGLAQAFPMKQALPIDAILPEVVSALRNHSSLVLQAPTGAGKTTRVPPALLDAGLAGNGQIIMLEPRRLAARAAARRMSIERGTALGDAIGYQVRFDRRAGSRTQILVVTPGILLRMLQGDPFLENISIVLFDEFHERGLESDLALGMVRVVQQSVRPELRIVVMSATLDSQRVANYLGCPVIASEGRLFPVDLVYQPKPNEQSWPIAAANAVRRLLDRTEDDVLVFLPGMGEIRQTARELEPVAEQRDLAVLLLHGDLPLEQQDAALLPQDRRKVVLATNVAETSVTVEGITGVVDTGLARVLRFDPHVGLDRLEIEPVSKASADQRMGRAGRLRPGICVRLWSEVAHRSRPEQTEPEIRRIDMAGAVLQLLSMGEKEILHFPWLDPPPEAHVTQAIELLRRLGAIDWTPKEPLPETGRGESLVSPPRFGEGPGEGFFLTDLGKRMARLPVHPRLARLLIEGESFGCANRAALAAALLAERDPFLRSSALPSKSVLSKSDILDRVEALEEFERSGCYQFPIGELHRAGAQYVLRARDQLLRLLDGERGCVSAPSEDAHGALTHAHGALTQPRSLDDALLRSLFAAYPDRLARRRNPASPRGIMVGGRGVKLMPASRVVEPEFFLCIDVDAGDAEALVRLASGVRREWLPAERIVESQRVEFNPHTQKVEARRLVHFEDLLLDSTAILLPDAEATAPVLAAAALANWERIRPANDSPAGQYLVRLRSLRTWMPEVGLPAFDDADMRELLGWLCATCRSFDELRKADWLGTLQSRLTHAQRMTVEREAPERIEVPSGSRIALTYEEGRSPVLAVRIQELFGLADTPRIAGGRVKVLLHLLAPNFRPQQVTDDLASFWANTYPTVRKELRSRYPKHAWPEDPLAAEAVRRAKKKR